MSEFNTSKNKLSKIWERIEENKNQINQKDNTDQLDFFLNLLRQQNIRVPLEIFNSGDINITPNTDFIGTEVFTALQGEKMPTEASYDQIIDLELPEVLLPFVKYSIEINSLPDTEIHGITLYDRSDFVDDSVEVRGDGTLIFKTDRLPTSNTTIGGSSQFIFVDTFFTDNGISFDLSKKVWSGTIIENNDDVNAGNVTTINTVFTTSNVNCNLTNDVEQFQTNPFTNPNHKIISLTAISFTAVGDLTVNTFSGGGCDPEDIVTEDVTKTIVFADLDSYSIAFDLGILINSADIKSQEFERNGNWLFWSTLKQKVFQLNVFGSDGDFKEINISNFPNTNVGHTLPYTSITLKRNLVEIPDESEKESVQLGFERILVTKREFKNYVKISGSSASVPTFRFQLNGSFIVLSPAIVENPDTTDFPVYDDIYTVVGTTYSITTEDHTILSLVTYLPETQDITINIKAHLINPLYWREQRKYKKNDI